MSASVLPYDKILRDGEEKDYIVIRFSGFNSNIMVRKEYCVNPGCNCTDAVPTFIELTEEGKALNDWFMVRLDMRTWEVTGYSLI